MKRNLMKENRLLLDIKEDLKVAIKDKNLVLRDSLRLILGEVARLPTKSNTEDDIIKIISKLIKNEKEVNEKKNKTFTDNLFIIILEGYLPKKATDEEIIGWIRTNIDFSDYKNKIQAMKPIMTYFGNRADGVTVSAILKVDFDA